MEPRAAACHEDHSIKNINKKFLLLCGETVVAFYELEPGAKQELVQAWAQGAGQRHASRRPRPCQVSTIEGDWCFGESHKECREA